MSVRAVLPKNPVRSSVNAIVLPARRHSARPIMGEALSSSQDNERDTAVAVVCDTISIADRRVWARYWSLVYLVRE